MKRIIIVCIVLFVFTKVNICYATWSRWDDMNRADNYATQVWSPSANGSYNGSIIFYSGQSYTGVAYWLDTLHGDWDTLQEFMDKMDSPDYRPRENAGIDCSAFLSHCWGQTRHTTSNLHKISYTLKK